MGKKAKAKREATAKPVVAGPPRRTGPNWPLLALSVIGMILTGYLSWTAMSHESVKGCGVGSACDVVLSSPVVHSARNAHSILGLRCICDPGRHCVCAAGGPSLAVRMGGLVLWHSLQRLSHNRLVNRSQCGMPVLPDIPGIDDRNLRAGHVATSKRPDRFLLG